MSKIKKKIKTKFYKNFIIYKKINFKGKNKKFDVLGINTFT